MKLSRLTVIYGVYIVLSAAFAQQVWGFLGQALGAGNLRVFCITAFLFFSLWVFIYLLKSRAGILRIFVSVVILACAVIFSWRQPYFVEKIHVFEYGLLGWLAARDFNRQKSSLGHVLLSMLFVLWIASLDEIFQRFLPYRVGDIRDVLTDFISGNFGIILFLLR